MDRITLKDMDDAINQLLSEAEAPQPGFDKECTELAKRLIRWRNRAYLGLRAQTDLLYADSPVEDQDEFERGREHGLSQVMELINKRMNDC